MKFQIDTSISNPLPTVVQASVLQLSSVAWGRFASVVMAAKPSGKFDTSLAIYLWTHCVFYHYETNEFIQLLPVNSKGINSEKYCEAYFHQR